VQRVQPNYTVIKKKKKIIEQDQEQGKRAQKLSLKFLLTSKANLIKSARGATQVHRKYKKKTPSKIKNKEKEHKNHARQLLLK
jgi:hypothetical protein